MKILESQSAVLSNYEVLAHLSARPPSAHQQPPNVTTVLKEVTDYLSPPPHSRSPIPRCDPCSRYSDAAVRTLVQALKPYGLTKSEVLMVLNLRPEELGLLDAVVEECDQRFSGEEQEGMLRVVGDVLGRGEVVNGGGANGEEGEEGGGS